MPDKDNLLQFFNQHSVNDEKPHAVVRLEIGACKLEVEVNGNTDSFKQVKEIIETCITSASIQNNSAKLLVKVPSISDIR
ncbi:hypothetical protein [Acinetobacter soli]|uniref:Uncharacterized protein n=1 Tax=Acinetobacter soli TaxID=487316 RepID=A0A1P8EGA2_9GAMM|nr:hypothetical protein [Acinetobacter soli]APV35239.1 hypothetical protein BEN76_04080 [Acinetobacter soli]